MNLPKLISLPKSAKVKIDIPDLTFKNPTPVRDLLRSGGVDGFRTWIRKAAPEAWNAYGRRGKTEAQRVLRFAEKCPDGAKEIAAWIATAVPAPALVPVTPPPAVVTSWTDRLKRPLLLMDGPAYFWWQMRDRAAIRAWLTAIRDAGLDGVDLELNGAFPVYEYIGQRIKNLDVAAVYAQTFGALGDWMPEIRGLGLIAEIKGLNSNNSDANSQSDAWWKWVGQNLASFGAANLLVLPLNETDTRTRPSIGRAIEAGLLAGGFPKAQLIGYDTRGDRGFAERHPKNIANVIKGDRALLQISDNGTTIGELYGSKWTAGGTPNAANIAAYVQRIRAAGTSGGIYSFRREPDLAGLAAAGAAWKGGTVSPGVPAGGARLTKFEKASKDKYVNFAVSGIEQWSERDGKDGKKPTCGTIVIKGVSVEHIRKGMTSQHLKNAYGKRGPGEHGVAIAKGETLQVLIRSYDSSETNTLNFVWPWEST